MQTAGIANIYDFSLDSVAPIAGTFVDSVIVVYAFAVRVKFPYLIAHFCVRLEMTTIYGIKQRHLGTIIPFEAMR